MYCSVIIRCYSKLEKFVEQVAYLVLLFLVANIVSSCFSVVVYIQTDI